MASYILTWNPKQWNWTTYAEDVAACGKHGTVNGRWSTGNTLKIAKNDHVYLMRLGNDPRGIIADGVATSDVYQDAHWDSERKKTGDTANYVSIRWQRLLHADIEPELILPLKELESAITDFPKAFFASGIRISDDADTILSSIWSARLRTRIPFRVGHAYTRREIQVMFGVSPTQGGDWATGHHREGDHTFIFANIGVPGRTGHDYNNYWQGDTFYWETKGTLTQNSASVQAMLNPSKYGRVLLFTRRQDRDPFTFEGIASPVTYSGDRPVQIIWRLTRECDAQAISSPGEVINPGLYFEGATRLVAVNVYERNPAARRACIEHYGCVCVVCGFDFEAVYGELGSGFIHVHHVIPLASVNAEYVVDPVKDLLPVCPNCHSMIHRNRVPLAINELRRCLGMTY